MKIIKSINKYMVMSVASLAFAGILSSMTYAKPNIKISSPSGKVVRVAKGKKVKLKAIVEQLKDKKVSFKTNNPKVVRVSANGTVKGITAGKTKITVVSNSNPKIKKTIKVVVYKKAVKKIKLGVKKINLNAGEKYKLKAKVKPAKNVSKTLKYTSSNKKVATVTKKGVIKARAAGIAKITVKATDGSKKKAVCNVDVSDSKLQVADSTEIKSIKVRGLNSLDIELSRKKVIEPGDIKVSSKHLAEGKEYFDYRIVSLNTTDNIHYEVVLNRKVYFGSYINVKIDMHPGIKTKEQVVDECVRFDALFEGDSVDIYYMYSTDTHMILHFGNFFNGNQNEGIYGDRCEPIKYTIIDIPKDKDVVLKYGGTDEYSLEFNKPYYDYKMVVLAEDANGNKKYCNYHFFAGDEETVYARAHEDTYLAYKANSSYEDRYIEGDEEYIPIVLSTLDKRNDYINAYKSCVDYKATGLPDNTEITESGYIRVKDYTLDVKPGTYNITITATTKDGKELVVPYKLNLVEGVVVSGKFTDALGNPIKNEKIYCDNYYGYEYEYGIAYGFNQLYGTAHNVGRSEYTYTDNEGNYKMRVIPGVYNIYSFNNDGITFYRSEKVSFKSNITYNIKSNIEVSK